MRLTREVRFSLAPEAPSTAITNSWGGWPGARGFSAFVTLRVTVGGSVDAQTGYLCNITVIDRMVRREIIPFLRLRWLAGDGDPISCEQALMEIAPILDGALPQGVVLDHVEMGATPYLTFTLSSGDPAMVSITQQFEFSAAHRLYCRDLSDKENARIFGKCTNPNGHGHNYVVEVTVQGTPDPQTGRVIGLPEFEGAVKKLVIDRLDHKHLNLDCPEFAELNPSVENITKAIWGMLEGRLEPARLTCVKVYETAKTCVEYRGPTDRP